MPGRTPIQRESLILRWIFIGALLLHFWLATRNWMAGFMPGHEFRQAQTAITSYYIDQDDNFSLFYETPVLGKPWVALLLEVPVYEWSVVGLSRLAGIPHYLAARTISLACFYFFLPAVFLLLGRFGVSRPRRLLTLVLILCCPVYIFYSRAFLMESMELMCCAWFLVGFVGMMDRRRWPWFLLATVAGTGAALIKSITFAVWLLPAAAYVLWLLGREWRAGRGWAPLFQTIFWGLAGVVVPLGALRLWIDLSDPIKASHASAWIFTAKNLSQGNWGLVDFAARLSPKTWAILLERWSEALLPSWLIIGVLGAGLLALPVQRWRVAGMAGVFFLAQLLFPFAYAYQEYYYYACAVFLLAGFGFMLQGLLDSRLPRWLCWLLVLVLPAAQLHTYWRVYYWQQIILSNGGFTFTEALNEFTPRESVIIVAGADWAAIVPLYSQRRALMVRNGLVNDRAYLNRAFAELGDEDVSALVLLHEQRKNTLIRDLAVARFGLEAAPTFSHAIADVYCSLRCSDRVREGVRLNGYYGKTLTVVIPSTAPPVNVSYFWISPSLARMSFRMVSPAPIRARFNFGLKDFLVEGIEALNAHPDSDLWLHAPVHATRIIWDYGMFSTAWEKAGDKTDGVDLTIVGQLPGGAQRVIFQRTLDPANRVADRGRQHESIPYDAVPGELLQFSSRPHRSYAYDWLYWVRIDVR